MPQSIPGPEELGLSGADVTSALSILALALLVVALAALRLRQRTGGPGRRGPARPRAEGVPVDVAWIWTTHVRERMDQRDVSAERVEQTLRAPTRVTPDPAERSQRFEREFRDELVKVWVSADPWPPRGELVIKSTAAQRIAVLRIDRRRIGRLIGQRGATIRSIRAATGTRIEVAENGTVTITGDTRAAVQRAERAVRQQLRG